MSNSRTVKVLALSLGGGLTQLVGLVSGAVLARLLTKEDLGSYRQTLLAYNFVAPLLGLSLPVALYYFLPRKAGNEKSVLVTSLLLLLGMGLVYTLFLLLGGAQLLSLRFHNPELRHMLLLMCPYALFTLPSTALEACLVVRGQILQLTVFNILSRAILAFAMIGTCFLYRSPESLILVNSLVTGVMLVPSVVLMLRACPGRLAWPTWGMMLEILRYSVPLGIAGVLGMLTLQLSNLVVAMLCSRDEFAVYSQGAIELPLIGLVTGSITTVIMAEMSKLCEGGRYGEALALFHKAAIRSAVVLLPAMIFFLIAARPFILTLFSSKYAESVLPFRLFLLVLPVRIVNYGVVLLALGKTKQVLVRSSVDFLLSGVLCALLVHFLGYLGGVLATLATLYLWSVPFNSYAIANGLGVRPGSVLPFGALSKIATIAVVAAVPAWLFLRFSQQSPSLELVIAVLAYWPLLFLILSRFGFLPIPSTFKQITFAVKSRLVNRSLA